MNSETKKRIIDALEVYMTDNAISQNDVAERTDVNASYLIRMRAGYEDIKIGVKTVQFKVEFYNRIANFIGLELSPKIIKTKPTKQFAQIIAALTDSRENSEVTWIIAETGAGKTYALEQFQRRYPAEVFNVKIGSSDKLADVLMKIAVALRLDFFVGSRSSKISQIVSKLKSIRNKGLRPQLNLDEAEFSTTPFLCAYKEVFDFLIDICPVNFIGTPDLINKVEALVLRNKPGMPQLYRRIKFKIKKIAPIDKRYELFLEGIDPELKSWLRENCNNYGELTDVLTPCLRESQRTGKPLTLDFAKIVLGL